MLDLLIQNAALPDGRVGTSVAVRGGKIVEATNAAKVMHLKGYGLEVGCDASFVLLQARDPIEAIRLRANRLKMWRKGSCWRRRRRWWRSCRWRAVRTR